RYLALRERACSQYLLAAARKHSLKNAIADDEVVVHRSDYMQRNECRRTQDRTVCTSPAMKPMRVFGGRRCGSVRMPNRLICQSRTDAAAQPNIGKTSSKK